MKMVTNIPRNSVNSKDFKSWIAYKWCLCLGISNSNNSFQRLSSPSTSDLLMCPTYNISWTLAPSITKGPSGPRTIVGVCYEPKTIATIIANFSRPRTTPTPSCIFWKKTPLVWTSLSLARTRSTWTRATLI